MKSKERILVILAGGASSRLKKSLNDVNLDKNITEYYNLIYEYKNDCLIAGVEYNKSNYADGDLKPEENLFFKMYLNIGNSKFI